MGDQRPFSSKATLRAAPSVSSPMRAKAVVQRDSRRAGTKRKGDGKGAAGNAEKKPKMSFCFGYQEGVCEKGDSCRFLHRCSVCYSKDHGSQDPACKGE